MRLGGGEFLLVATLTVETLSGGGPPEKQENGPRGGRGKKNQNFRKVLPSQPFRRGRWEEA